MSSELLRCYSCDRPIRDVIIWLGETPDSDAVAPKEYPFHEFCAQKPWPLAEVRREVVENSVASR